MTNEQKRRLIALMESEGFYFEGIAGGALYFFEPDTAEICFESWQEVKDYLEYITNAN